MYVHAACVVVILLPSRRMDGVTQLREIHWRPLGEGEDNYNILCTFKPASLRLFLTFVVAKTINTTSQTEPR